MLKEEPTGPGGPAKGAPPEGTAATAAAATAAAGKQQQQQQQQRGKGRKVRFQRNDPNTFTFRLLPASQQQLRQDAAAGRQHQGGPRMQLHRVIPPNARNKVRCFCLLLLLLLHEAAAVALAAAAAAAAVCCGWFCLWCLFRSFCPFCLVAGCRCMQRRQHHRV